MSGHDQDKANTQPDDYIHPLARPLLWVDAKWVRWSAIWVLLAASVALALVDFLHIRHEYLGFADFPSFYVLMGFGCFVFAVLVGRMLRSVIMRPEDYYDGAADND